MIKVEDTPFFNDVLKIFNYPFGKLYIFSGFVISEIGEGIVLSWDNAKQMVEDVEGFLGTNGKDLVYISNRINSYSVVPQDWLKYFKLNYGLKAYFVVTAANKGSFNITFEKLFFRSKIKTFTCLVEAVNKAKTRKQEVA